MNSLVMSENGRVVIPAAMRAALGLKPRMPLYAEIRDGGLFLTTAEQRSSQRKAYFDRWLTAPSERIASTELVAERRKESTD
jgi:bifunctional DNA-binding transcriptional regulator/antitoxin component of YhaV-PrlF toxin-antitoxin module